MQRPISRGLTSQVKDSNLFHFPLSFIAGVVVLQLSLCANAATLTATINDAVFSDGSTVSGSFTYDPSTGVIVSSSVMLNDSGLGYVANLTDTQDSSIIIHATPVSFAEFVLVAQHPSGTCSTGSQCGTTYASLTLLSLPSTSGTYPLICGLCDGNPNENTYTSSDIIVDPPNYKGSVLNTEATLTIVNSGPPAVELTPPYLEFSSAGNTLPITVMNSGGGILNIAATPTPIGSNASDFTVANGTTCVGGVTISPQESCIVEVTFTPSTDAWEVATLTLFDNASYGPQTVPLSGGGQLISIFPNPVQGSTSPQTVTITGTGFIEGATINWQDLTMSPWTASPQWTGAVTPQSISPDSITASMNFSPASAIWQIAVVNPGQARNSPSRTSNFYPFQVIGTGSASPSLLDDYPFKNANVDDSGDYGRADECTSYVAWRMNRDNGTTDPKNPSFFNKMAGGTWDNADHWGVNATSLNYQPDPKPQVGDIAQWDKPGDGHVAYVERVDPDGSVDVSEYNFGLDNGGIKYEYGVRNVPGPTNQPFPNEFIHISRLSLSPTSLDFGAVGIGRSSSFDVVVTNSLAQMISPVITVGASEASTADTGDFTETDTCSGTNLLPNAQCGITVTFEPPSTLKKGGSRSAAIILNWGAGPQLIPVNGIAITNLNPSPESLSFGKIPVGQTSAVKSVKLTNHTGADVSILSISPGPEFNTTGCSAPLADGSSCTVSITFSPNAKGHQSTTLTITDTAINSPQTVSLEGTGT